MGEIMDNLANTIIRWEKSAKPEITSQSEKLSIENKPVFDNSKEKERLASLYDFKLFMLEMNRRMESNRY